MSVNIVNMIKTRPNERPMFGQNNYLDIYKYFFKYDDNDGINIIQIKKQIQNKINYHFPQVQVKDILISEQHNTIRINCIIEMQDVQINFSV